MNVFISKGLDLDDLTEIHIWLIDDFFEDQRSSLLYNFMELVKDKKNCWGLFEQRDGYHVCIGFAQIASTVECAKLELFSIHPNYRGKGLGKSFANTLINNIENDTVKLSSLTNSVEFWIKIGFVKQFDNTMILTKLHDQNFTSEIAIIYK